MDETSDFQCLDYSGENFESYLKHCNRSIISHLKHVEFLSGEILKKEKTLKTAILEYKEDIDRILG